MRVLAVREVTVLRRCIIRGWLKAGARAARSEGVTVLDEALDQLSLAVLDCWTQAQQRTFKALDRVSDMLAQSRHLPELLAGLARLLAEAGSHARWVEGRGFDPDHFERQSCSTCLLDGEDRAVALFPDEWALSRAQDLFPALTFLAAVQPARKTPSAA